MTDIKKFGCKYCLFEKRKLDETSTFGTLEELQNHVEKEHDLVIPRKGETEDQAWDRATKNGTRIGTPNCRCPLCKFNMQDMEVTVQLLNDGLLVLKNGTTYIAQIDEPLVEFTSENGG